MDKSALIDELLRKKKEVYLFTRPRRFGKSLNLSMLDAYFNERYAGNPWFDDLGISNLRPDEQCSARSPFILGWNLRGETSYELVIMALLYGIAGSYDVHTESEAGNGRVDIIMKPKHSGIVPIIFELKKIRRGEGSGEGCLNGLGTDPREEILSRNGWARPALRDIILGQNPVHSSRKTGAAMTTRAPGHHARRSGIRASWETVGPGLSLDPGCYAEIVWKAFECGV